ncbi:CCA tRNA nucleotidyltransferase [Roseovarius aestuariivivens]|uniref:CCA tRNA nucleotidyltransferase n=1 Tax=Roseovarius aestuariivivens TaxID=1888910 RepID=UPI00107FF8AE|nr:CCA tRNA nucleotidyltransferase [Roseovarius aestuariivivens]
MTRVAGPWIDAPETQAVCAMLEEAGHEAYLVGGCVRNALLNEPVGDVDITTDAHPERVIALAEAAGLKPVPTGIDHGTVTVIANGTPFEVTTFRKDVETDGRHAVVSFAEDITSDARRRDFTVNALYARRDGTVLDPLGGMADITDRRIRFIDDAELRIREDYLRILRFFRFYAWYGDPEGGLDRDGLAACADLADGIDGLSRERIGAEMRKLLAAPDPAPAVAAMRQAGALSHVLPGSTDAALSLLIHLEIASGVDPDPIRRLACLGGESVDTALRLSRAEARDFARIRAGALGSATAGELGYRLGPDRGRDALLLRAALMEQGVRDSELADITRGARAVLPVSATDFMPDLSGPELGAKLKDLETAWIASDFTLDRDTLLQEG